MRETAGFLGWCCFCPILRVQVLRFTLDDFEASLKDVALVRELVAMKAPLNSTLPALVEARNRSSMIHPLSAVVHGKDVFLKTQWKSLDVSPKMASMSGRCPASNLTER